MRFLRSSTAVLSAFALIVSAFPATYASDTGPAAPRLQSIFSTEACSVPCLYVGALMDPVARAIDGFQPLAIAVLVRRRVRSGTLHRIGRPSTDSSKTFETLRGRDAYFRRLAKGIPPLKEKVAGERVVIVYTELPDEVSAYHVARRSDKDPLLVVLNMAHINKQLEHEAVLHEVLEEAWIRRDFSPEEAHRLAWAEALQWHPSRMRPSGLTSLQEAELRRGRSDPQKLMELLAETSAHRVDHRRLMERANRVRKDKPIDLESVEFHESLFRKWTAYYLLEPEEARKALEPPAPYEALLKHLPIFNDMVQSNALGLEAIRTVWHQNRNLLIQSLRTVESHRQVFDELCADGMLGLEAMRAAFIKAPAHFGASFASIATHIGAFRKLFNPESLGAESMRRVIQKDPDAFWLLAAEITARPKLLEELCSQKFLTMSFMRDAFNENPNGLAKALLFLIEDEDAYERFQRAFETISRSTLRWDLSRLAFVYSPLLFVQALASWGNNTRFITPYLDHTHVDVAKLSHDLKVPIEFHASNAEARRTAQGLVEVLDPRGSDISILGDDALRPQHPEALAMKFSEGYGFRAAEGDRVLPIISISPHADLQLAKAASPDEKFRCALPRDRKIIVGWDLSPSEITLLTDYYVESFAALPQDKRPLLILAVDAANSKGIANLRAKGLRVATRKRRAFPYIWHASDDSSFSELDIGFSVSDGILENIPEIADMVVTGSDKNLQPFLGKIILYFRHSDESDARLVNKLGAFHAAVPVDRNRGPKQLLNELLLGDEFKKGAVNTLKELKKDYGTALCFGLQIANDIWSKRSPTARFQPWTAPSGAFAFNDFLKRVLARQVPPEKEHIIEPSEQVRRFLTAYGLLEHKGSLEFDPKVLPASLRQPLRRIFGSHDADVTEFLQIFTGDTLETIKVWREEALAHIAGIGPVPWWAEVTEERSLLHEGHAVMERLRDRFRQRQSLSDVGTEDIALLAPLIKLVEHCIGIIEARAVGGQTSLNDVIQSVLRMRDIIEGKVHIRLELPDGPDDTVPLSREDLYGIVYNLAYNTASYAQSGFKELVIRYSTVSKTLVLEDNGGGFKDASLLVPNEQGMQPIFELGHSSGESKEGHYGIGLHHIYLISVDNGVTVTADNGDFGARYTFKFRSSPGVSSPRSVRDQA